MTRSRLIWVEFDRGPRIEYRAASSAYVACEQCADAFGRACERACGTSLADCIMVSIGVCLPDSEERDGRAHITRICSSEAEWRMLCEGYDAGRRRRPARRP